MFWTATDNISFLYTPRFEAEWFLQNGRPFGREARAFAAWMRNQDTLLIDSVENATGVSRTGGHPFEPVYCDDFQPDAWWHDRAYPRGWFPLCGEVSDYIVHSGVGIDKVVFVGAFRDRLASGAIRADGVFAPHTIYVDSADGSTSQATPVLAAYATSLAASNPSLSAAGLKRELFALAVDEVVDYRTGRTTESGTIVPEKRTVKVLRPGQFPKPAASCHSDQATLCLQDNRYAVTVEWSTIDGDSGSGRVAGAGTADSGLFYFFDADNWEMLVKVLDGCGVNGHHWVFAASATDVGLDLKVTDTQTGFSRRYTKDPGEAARAINDVGAFPDACAPSG